MATLLLVDGVASSWGNQLAAANSSFLSSLHTHPPHFSLPPCTCNHHCEPPLIATRCASSNNLIDRLDPPLPRFPSRQHPIKASEVSRYRVIMENKPTWNQSHAEESFARLEEPSLRQPHDNLEQPSSHGNGDIPSKLASYADGQELDMRWSQRISPSYLSISRSRRSMANGATLQVAPTPLRYKDLKGASGFYVGIAAFVLGFMAVLQKGGLLGVNNPPTALCSKCDGYGRKLCSLCKGRGSVTWEGKLKHVDLCPSCFGARIRKCADCGGYCMRSDEPPFLQPPLKSRSLKARP